MAILLDQTSEVQPVITLTTILPVLAVLFLMVFMSMLHGWLQEKQEQPEQKNHKQEKQQYSASSNEYLICPPSTGSKALWWLTQWFRSKQTKTKQDQKNELVEELLICQPSTGYEDDWYQLYESAFPVEERITLERIRNEISVGKRALHRTFNKSTGDLLCISIVYFFDDFMWLSYLASNPIHRSQGVGSKHLTSLIELLKKQYPNAVGLFLNIESPTQEGLDEETRHQRERRLHFYQKLGAKRMPTDKKFFMINEIPGEPPLPAEIVWYEFKTQESTSHLKYVVRAAYEQIYELSPDDPFIDQIADQF